LQDMRCAASFYTTFDGMLNFMPLWAVAFCIVFAIQALLFVASWRLGFAAADRESPPLFTAFVFLICLATSVFFSAVSLFESINDEETQARTRETRMHRVVEEAIVETEARAEAERRAQGEALTRSDAYAAWSGSVDRVAEAALAARGALQTALAAEADALAAEARAIEAERAALLRSGAEGAARADAASREIDRLERQRASLLERIDQFRADVDAAAVAVELKQGQMDAEERGGAAGRGSGRGPIWRGLRDEREVLQAELEARQRLLARTEASLSDAEASLGALRAEVAAAASAGEPTAQTVLQARLDSVNERLALRQAGAGGAAEAETAALREAVAAFKTSFKTEAFQAAAARCDALLDQMRGAPGVATAGLSCGPQALAPALNKLTAAETALATLTARCAPGGAGAPGVAALGFKEAAAHGRACIALSALPAAQMADLREAIGRVTLEEDANASNFVKTVNAWAAGDKLSYFALAIALFIDLLVLLSGMIGAVSVTSEFGRAFGRGFAKRDIEDARRALSLKDGDPFAIARGLLEIVEPTDDKRYAGEIRIDAAPAALRGGARQFLLMQTEKGLAARKAPRPTGATPLDQGAPLVFLVQDRVLSALRAYLEETAALTAEAQADVRRLAQERAEAAPRARDTAYLLEQLGAPERRGRILDAAFRALTPAAPTPRRWWSLADWLRPRPAAELRFDHAAALLAESEQRWPPRGADKAAETIGEDGEAVTPSAEEPSASPSAAPDREALARLGFALYRRRMAEPISAVSGGAEGYRLTHKALNLLERCAKIDAASAEAGAITVEPVETTPAPMTHDPAAQDPMSDDPAPRPQPHAALIAAPAAPIALRAEEEPCATPSITPKQAADIDRFALKFLAAAEKEQHRRLS
ncbi:MAG: hypothetical protein AAGM38_18500, partial [Pseudomonadota bacterium]